MALESAGHRRGLDPAPRDPGRGQHRPGRRSPPICDQVDGIHGAVAPSGPRVAPRRRRTRRGDPGPRQRHAATGHDTLDGVRDTAHAAGPDVRVGGGPAANQDFIDAVYGNFPLMIALIAITTFILLARAFRSLLLPLKAIDPQHPQRRRGLGRAGAGLAGGPRLRGDLGHPGDRLDPVLDAADRLRLPVRPLDGLRGVHPLPHAGGVRPHRVDRRGRGRRASGAPGAW